MTLFLTALFGQSVAYSMIAKYDDLAADCTRYSVIKKVRDDNGDLNLERDLIDGEKIINTRIHYGLSTSNLQIDFDRRAALLEIITNVTLGVNQNLLGRDVMVEVEEGHPQFEEILNSLNRRVLLFDQVCVRDQKIIYVN